MEMSISVAKLSGLAWATDILTGQKPFPINKQSEDKGFKDILDKEIKAVKGEEKDAD